MPLELQDPTALPKDFPIFYCWQDHLNRKHHRNLIRAALSTAINLIQDEIPEAADCTLRLDSDTSGRAGSIDIANTILQKIAAAKIVVGDVTPLIIKNPQTRKYPNPNVMLELGYAAHAVGWNRVICVFNAAVPETKERLKPEDLPFDIRHRRINSFVCRADSGVAQATKELEAELVAAIRAIIQEIDSGEFDPTLTGSDLKRSKDVRLLRTLLSRIHRSSMDRYIEHGLRDNLYDDCSYFWIGFEAIVCSSHFQFYDKKLEQLTEDLWRVWGKATFLASYVFSPIGSSGSFAMKEHKYWNDSYEQEVKQLRECFEKLPIVFRAFLDYIHSEYPEIDLDETDKIAWEDNLPYIRGDMFNIESDNDSDPADEDK